MAKSVWCPRLCYLKGSLEILIRNEVVNNHHLTSYKGNSLEICVGVCNWLALVEFILLS